MNIPGGSMIKNSTHDDLAALKNRGFTVSPANLRATQITWVQNHFQPHFDKWVIEPIEDLINTQHALAGFILMTCAIDYLAGFYWGQSTKQNSKKAYTQFVGKYFPSCYDPEELYDSLRNGLVHMFTIKNKTYSLIHNRSNLHLQADKHGQTILNAQDFFNDLKVAKDQYFVDVVHQQGLLDKLIDRYQRDGFLNSDDIL